MGVKLSRDEQALLLSLLTTESERAVSSLDKGDEFQDGNVSYRELLKFCAEASGKWFDHNPDLASLLRSSLRDSMRKKSWVADLRSMFEEMDEDDDGLIGQKEFVKGCRKLGLKIDRGGLEKLMELLDLDGSGGVSYEHFVAFFSVTKTQGAWHDAEPELARKLRDAVRKSKGRMEETVGGFRDECAKYDEEGTGNVSPKEIRKAIGRTLKGCKLSENEMSRLEVRGEVITSIATNTTQPTQHKHNTTQHNTTQHNTTQHN